jgi:hypothetical protein
VIPASLALALKAAWSYSGQNHTGYNPATENAHETQDHDHLDWRWGSTGPAVRPACHAGGCCDLRRLPPDYKGEKHVVIAKELPSQNGLEWVEFEEVPGPDPNPEKLKAGRPEYLDVMFVGPYPVEDEAHSR